jgi:transposase
MKFNPPELKHFILTKYRSNTRGCGFEALAHQYGIAGGGKTIQRWYGQWDGTAASLKRKPGAGRPRLLSEDEVHQYITTPIKNNNRKAKPVQYRDVLHPLRQKTGKAVSLRTVRRYGKENAGINLRTATKKTEWECKSRIHTSSSGIHISLPSGSLNVHVAHHWQNSKCLRSCVMTSQT